MPLMPNTTFTVSKRVSCEAITFRRETHELGDLARSKCDSNGRGMAVCCRVHKFTFNCNLQKRLLSHHIIIIIIVVVVCRHHHHHHHHHHVPYLYSSSKIIQGYRRLLHKLEVPISQQVGTSFVFGDRIMSFLTSCSQPGSGKRRWNLDLFSGS